MQQWLYRDAGTALGKHRKAVSGYNISCGERFACCASCCVSYSIFFKQLRATAQSDSVVLLSLAFSSSYPYNAQNVDGRRKARVDGCEGKNALFFPAAANLLPLSPLEVK